MACTDCFNTCADKLITDRCVQYTGADIPALEICNGDSLYQVEAIILKKLQELADVGNVVLTDIDLSCSFLKDLLNNADPTISNLMQMFATASCDLYALIKALETQINTPFSINAPCLALPINPTRDQTLVATASKVCVLSTDVNTIKADYVKASELCAAVELCIGSPGATIQENTKMPKYVAMAYMGPLTVFDSTGKGLEAFGYDKVYICNGNNGTQDMRGRAVVGANTNVVGPALDAAVNPALPDNIGYNVAQNTKLGNYTNTLSTDTIPSHTHAVTDPGHSHTYVRAVVGDHPSGNSVVRPTIEQTTNTSTSLTGVTIASTGNGQPHNNVQPSFGCVYIVYLP
jgi:microcystin-dependent protein